MALAARKRSTAERAKRSPAPSSKSTSRKAAPRARRAAPVKVKAAPNAPTRPPAVDAAANDAQAAALPMQAYAEGLETVLRQLGPLGTLNWPPEFLNHVQSEYVQRATQLWESALSGAGAQVQVDKRFAAAPWAQQPLAAFTASLYLLNAQTLNRLAEGVLADSKFKARLRFAVQQWVEAACPANYLALNPEALQLAMQTQGESLQQGLQHLLQDLAKGQLSQSDETQFEVGKNLAITPGSVVFENEYFQLLEYRAQTAKVHQRPLLMVPPCINKYYILDLRPDNSLAEYAVSQGHRVFMVSWINPDESMATKTWDDYVEHGVIQAIDTVRAITGQDTINGLGFCIGGTLLANALSVLQGRGREVAHSLTLLTAFLDFHNTGVMDVFIDEAAVRMREYSIGERSPSGGGMMSGRDLAATFSFLRPTDLVWNYVVGNYLKGGVPPAFDLLYWNADSTNLPGPMYCWYLRHTYLENQLIVPGGLTVCGQPVRLQQLRMPAFIYGSREDHIVPWDSAYASTQVLGGDKTFVLGASGHIAGVINPPSKNKRSHWTGARLVRDPKEWLQSAQEHPGSWWPVWSTWLAEQAGPLLKAPSAEGSRRFQPIEPAPGRYVKVRA